VRPRRHVDDAATGARGHFLFEQPPFTFFVVHEPDPEPDVRPVAVVDQLPLVTHSQYPHDLVPDRLGGRRRQREDAGTAEFPHRGAQAEVVRPEVVPPFTDTVGFVDHEQHRTGRPNGFEHLGVGQLFRCQQKEFELTRGESVQYLPPPPGSDRRVDAVRGQPTVPQRLDLVTLQRQRRGDDHRRAPQPQTRDGVDGRLPAGRGEHDESVRLPDRLQRFDLLGP
jgi:hypothetical protein